jgi:hypothetical protein
MRKNKIILNYLVYFALLFLSFSIIDIIKEERVEVLQNFIKAISTILIIMACRKLWDIRKRMN